MRKAWSLLLLVCLVMAPAALAKPQPAVLFLADDTVPVGAGALSTDWPEGNASRVRIVTSAPSPELLVTFAANQTGGTRLYGPAFAAVWPDKPLAENGSLLRVALRLDGEVVAEQSLPMHFDPNSAPDPTAFIPPDPTDPEAAAFHIVAQALPLIYTPYALVYFGFLDVEVPEDAVVSLTLEVVPGGTLPAGTVLLKYDSVITPSYLYLPWWVPDPAPTTTSTSRAPMTSQSMGPSPAPSATSEPAGKDSPALPLAAIALVLGAIAVRRRF